MITALAIMIAIAGYLNFAGSKISEDVVTADNTNMEGEDVTALLDISEEDI
ncbi:MAG: SpoIIIAH-like family protein, partial [Lachnospiraceae bacterium]